MRIIDIIRFGNFNDAMHMIGHNDIGMQNHKWKMFRNFLPTFFRNFPDFRQKHFTLLNLPEITNPVFATNGHKIQGLRPIIPMPQARRGDSIFIFEFFHFFFLLGHKVLLGHKRYCGDAKFCVFTETAAASSLFCALLRLVFY